MGEVMCPTKLKGHKSDFQRNMCSNQFSDHGATKESYST